MFPPAQSPCAFKRIRGRRNAKRALRLRKTGCSRFSACTLLLFPAEHGRISVVSRTPPHHADLVCTVNAPCRCLANGVPRTPPHIEVHPPQNQISGCSEAGIALDLGSRDRAFESPHSDQPPLKSLISEGVSILLTIPPCGGFSHPLYIPATPLTPPLPARWPAGCGRRSSPVPPSPRTRRAPSRAGAAR